MGFYRKKPVVIEAVQWTGANIGEVLLFTRLWNASYSDQVGLIIHSLEGDHKALPGDFIIKGVRGEFYACKPDIFLTTYDPAN